MSFSLYSILLSNILDWNLIIQQPLATSIIKGEKLDSATLQLKRFGLLHLNIICGFQHPIFLVPKISTLIIILEISMTIQNALSTRMSSNYWQIDLACHISTSLHLSYNHKISQYISHQHDPQSITIDAFFVSWVSKHVYAFPPFSLVFPTLRKISFEGCSVFMIVPFWSTQPLFPKLLHLLIDLPTLFFSTNHLHLPGTDQKYPMSPKLKMMAVKLLSDSSLLKNFHHQLLNLSCNLGEIPRPRHTTRAGIHFFNLRLGYAFFYKSSLKTCLEYAYLEEH